MNTIRNYAKALVCVVILGLASLSASAQENYVMKIWHGGAVTNQYPTTFVDSVTFELENPVVPADGVLINGIVWAKYNVDDPGTFAATPEATGKFYQWNRSAALVPDGGLDVSVPGGDSWETGNDPSPTGWHVPSADEISQLIDPEKVSFEASNLNGVDGTLFTDRTSGNTIFFPKAGRLDWNETGTHSYSGSRGYYWSSSNNNDLTTAKYLRADTGTLTGYDRSYAFSIRSVAN